MHPLRIAVVSGKGGTGKTLVATNLAAFCSQTGKVLLVDLDVEEPNDFIFFDDSYGPAVDCFKMIPVWDPNRCTLCGACSRLCKFHAVIRLGPTIMVFKELCHSCYACSELCPANALPMQKFKMGETRTLNVGNLCCIESRLELGEEQAVPLIRQTHHLVASTYAEVDLHIFDCPPGTSCPVIAAAKPADFVLLVTEPTPFGLNDLRLTVETMRGMKKPMGVIINRYGMGNDNVEKYCLHEHIPVLATIPYSREIASFYSKGTLVYDKVPGLAASFQHILQSIQTTVIPYE